jgi:photosystem II stability/assembly factor-like uncharacterized protein
MVGKMLRFKWLGMLVVALLVAAAVPVRAASGGNGGADKAAPGEEAHEIEETLDSFYEARSAPNEAIAPGAYRAAAAYASRVRTATTGAWTEIGPYNMQSDDPRYIDPVNSNSGAGAGLTTGRITALAVRPDGRTVFAGAADGGVWKSTDGGAHWTPVFDRQASLSIGAIAIDETGGGGYTVYVGTGEANTSSDSYAGVGVMKSTDGGSTWSQVGGTQLDGALIWKILVDPAHRVYAATSHGLFRMLPGQTSWTRILGVNAAPGDIVQNMVSDITLQPGTSGASGKLLAIVGWREGASTNGMYWSTDGGDHFTGPLQPQGYVSQASQGRATAAWSADGSRLYVMVQDPKMLSNNPQTVFGGVYVSKSGVSGPFNQIASPNKLATNGSAQQTGNIGPFYKPGVGAWYNQFIAVDPADANHVYVGLEEVYETTNGGSSWTTIGPYWNFPFKCFSYDPFPGTCPNTVHPDQHAIALANGKVWVGNDGGVFSRSLSNHVAGGWTNLDATMNTLQFYYAEASQPPGGRLTIYGGLQDNGTAKVIPGIEASEPFGGDGGDVIVDPRNPDKVVTEYVELTMAKSLNGGRTWTDIAPGDPLARFIAPFGADISRPSTWVAGGNNVWVSTDGFGTTVSSWVPVFNQGAGRSTTAVESSNGTVYAAWCGPCNPSFTTGAGFKSGISTNYGGTWHQLTPPLATRFPTAVTIDPANAAHAYVTYSGYSRRWIIGPLDPGVGHVFETNDGGAHWTDISGDLVDAPANDVVLVNGKLVVATDVGIFESGIHGGTWTKVGTNLPTVVTNDLAVTPNRDLIIAATHGRGLWSIPTSSL